MSLYDFKKQVKEFVFGRKVVSDFADYPLPLYMRQSAGLPPPEPPKVSSCSKCATRYFERTKGSFVPEDGMCHACSTGKPRALPARLAEVTPFQRPRKAKRG